VKRKRIVSILSRQATRLVKEDDKILKKAKSALEPKAAISKKRKLDMTPSAEPKVDEIGEEAPSTPSVVEVVEILKVMTDSPHFKLLSPLGSELTQFLQKKEQPSAAKEKVEGKMKQRIVNVMQAVEQTPPSALAAKIMTATRPKLMLLPK
jgi:DNA-directed RNA polymerase sigma subunit (sigma70/sigma32)